MSETPIRRVLSAIEMATGCPRQQSGGWIACCPAHEDRSPSLSIRAAEDGRVLLHCHAGCPTEAVLRALGLVWQDLMPQEALTPRRWQRQGGHYGRR